MEVLHECCCGLDVHAKTVVACLIEKVCPGFSSGDTCGKSAPFRVEQRLNSYRHHYSTAFAFSRIFSLHDTSAFLTVGLLGSFPPRIIQAYHVPQVVPTTGRRAPLSTGEDDTCVRRPLTSPDPASPPILGLEPVSRLRSAGVTMRNSEASLTVPIPVLPHSQSTVRLGFSTPAVCLRPHRYQGRPHRAGTEGTTS
jgi:hypothetical protein